MSKESVSGVQRAETVEGMPVFYYLEDGVRLYRGDLELRRLSQQFIGTTFRAYNGSQYRDLVIEQKLCGLAIIGTRGTYYGLDADGLNFFVKNTNGIYIVEKGEDLPDTKKLELENGDYVYYPTAALLEKFGVQKRPSYR